MDRLVATFAELRALADQGQTQYPYSTREAVAIVKHLANYPDEGIQARFIKFNRYRGGTTLYCIIWSLVDTH